MPPIRNSSRVSSPAPRRYSTRQVSKSKDIGQANGANGANKPYAHNYRDSSGSDLDADDSPSPALTSSPEPTALPIRKAREICTPEQKEELERFFEDSNGYPSRAEKEALSARIGKSLKSIEIWLQNKRHPRKSNSPGGRGSSGKSKAGRNQRKSPYTNFTPQDIARRSASTAKSPQTPIDEVSTPPFVVTPTTPVTAPADATPLPPLAPPIVPTIVCNNEPQTYKFVPGLPNDNVAVATVNRGPWLDQEEETRLWSVAVTALELSLKKRRVNIAVNALLSIHQSHS